MINLNLETTCHEQEKIKAYLENNVSEILADKINNGVKIEKDGKTLINKKDLVTFMGYAEEQVLEMIAENERKGRQMRCIDDPTVYGWAIHYFEEDSIEGKLYNEDGTEYQPPKPVVKPSTVAKSAVTYTPPKPAPKPQLNIFDMLSENAEEKTAETTETAAPAQTEIKIENENHEIYTQYCAVQNQYPEFVIAWKLGDFYEIFGDDATKISDDLDMTLTSKDIGLEKRIPIIGFPCRKLKKYIFEIVSHEHKLAVAESPDNIRRFIYQHNQVVEIDTGEILADDIEELSVEEMKQFDGELDEPEELMTVSKLIGEAPDEDNSDGNDIPDLLSIPTEQSQPELADDDFDIEKERQKIKAFDLEAMIILQELFDDKITLV